MTVKELQKKLKQYNPNDEVWFYHLKDNNLTQCNLENIQGGFNQKDLGNWIEFTIEEVSDDIN
tara:strand:+ start:432 stop:620 length:189 start_codon:yes stop_codon:yes gene_type:complete